MGRGHSSKRVALALGGGGARGLAHIGAIEELLRRGYIIHSVAGTSMGAIVGGFYACGQLEDLKQTFDQLSRRDIMSLINFSLGLDHVASGDKLEELMEDMLQGARIEDLPISYRCCASDLAPISVLSFAACRYPSPKRTMRPLTIVRSSLKSAL